MTLTDDLLPWYQRKGHITMNTSVKFETWFIIYHSKVMANVKAFSRQTDTQANRQTIKQTGEKLYKPINMQKVHEWI